MVEVKLKTDIYTGQSRGFAFLLFQSPESVDKVCVCVWVGVFVCLGVCVCVCVCACLGWLCLSHVFLSSPKKSTFFVTLIII